MKFGKIMLRASSVSNSVVKAEDWVDYKQLKKKLRRMQFSRVEADFDLKAQEREFFRAIAVELQKVDAAYAALKSHAMREVSAALDSSSALTPERCTELHLLLLLVENFAVLNYCGFSKILKKHDKVMECTTRDKFLSRHVMGRPFHQLADLRATIARVESKFAELVGLATVSSATTNTSASAQPQASSAPSVASTAAAAAAATRAGSATSAKPKGTVPRSPTAGDSQLGMKHASMMTLRDQVKSIDDEEGRETTKGDDLASTSSSSDDDHRSTPKAAGDSLLKRGRPADSALLLSLADAALRSPRIDTAIPDDGSRVKRLRSETPEATA